MRLSRAGSSPVDRTIFVVRKSYKTRKAQDLVGLVLFCYYILWFAHLAEYLNLGAAFWGSLHMRVDIYSDLFFCFSNFDSIFVFLRRYAVVIFKRL